MIVSIKDGGHKETLARSIIPEAHIGVQGNPIGPWTIVHKAKQSRRGEQDNFKKDINEKGNKELSSNKGSRFQALLKEGPC